MQQLKIIVVGPVGAGKTTISNFLADATEIPSDYRPTQGVRILEFESQNVSVGNRYAKAEIELWDCSGDHKFDACWPAIRKDIHAVVFVYNAKSQDNVRELEQFYHYFVNQTRLGPKNCVIFYNDPDNSAPGISKNILSSTFSRVSQVSCNVTEGADRLKVDFQAFLGTLLANLEENTHQEEMNIVRDNILFVK